MTVSRPTIYVTNWSSTKLHGSGRRFTIMARPRHWEHGEGRIAALVPYDEDLRALQEGAISMATYRRRYEKRLGDHIVEAILAPGRLAARTWGPIWSAGLVALEDGDTLCCACSREVAARGECHRVWAAKALVAAGWRVILDGEEVHP